MAARFQLVLEGVKDTKTDIPVLRFRDVESGAETPSFTCDVKRSNSYTNWNIEFQEETSTAVGSFFQEVIKASEYELVCETHKQLKLDGDMLSKLINSLIWLGRITCSDFSIEDNMSHVKHSVVVIY